ncbi:hypothetical protein [Paraburkholderia domus]|uniref:hypothetical protein n=1 Tax=Paraburkholderia domus TaxID=2793075 RepID=UPI0019128F29|nr:hypothetical protein [Paraburkholderia domus]MBK5064818.1 hypothetical protein [Burkholderia sp. R-70199]CAE6956782.1 hypothetical protein R70199_07015 [Paraburkholderia domus]
MLNFFSRAFDAFCGYGQQTSSSTPNRPIPKQPPAAAPAQPSAEDGEAVGQGAANETFVTIRDITHLFVQEADHVVHFEQEFDMVVSDTPVGKKLLPELFPRWQEKGVHHCSLKEAILNVIREQEPAAARSKPDPVKAKTQRVPEPVAAVKAPRSSEPTQPLGEDGSRPDYAGLITAWGEEKFARRNAQEGTDKFYTSFAIRLETGSGEEKIVQGEGLKDAITQCGCALGDQVGIRRLRKEKVQAFNRAGEARMKDGKPVYFDKWIWSIKHL